MTLAVVAVLLGSLALAAGPAAASGATDDADAAPYAVEEPVPEVAGAEPRDLDGDGRYEDVTGDGSFGQTDVVVFFEHKHRAPVQEHPTYFDFSGDGTAGHGDVVALFEGAVVDDPTTVIEPREPAPTDDFLATVDADRTAVEAGTELALAARDQSGQDHTIQALEWSFGDGERATGREVAHAFDEPGTYRVTLTATAEYGATTSHAIAVEVEASDDGDADDGQNDDGQSDPVVCDGTSPDSDGDGIPDCPEQHYDHLFPNADPAVFDVYVEVSHLASEFPLSDRELAELEAVFDDAPTEIDVELHVVDGGQVSYQGEYEIFEYHQFRDPVLECAGYHHGFVADRSLGEAGGYGIDGRFSVLEEGWAQQQIFLHELGHSMGLTEFDGIDSEQYSLEQYPSVMNYNGAYEVLQYSDGTSSQQDHDDWAVITGQDPSGYQPGYDGGCTDDRDRDPNLVSGT